MRRTRHSIILNAVNVKKSGFEGQAPKVEVAGLLPENRLAESELSYSDGKASVFAHARKGLTKAICQDTAMAFVSSQFILAGIFDGFMQNGEVMSGEVAEQLLALCHKETKKTNSAALLRNAVKAALENIFIEHPGGTTATLALVFPDGRYSISGVADSPVYLIDSEVRRLLKYDRVAPSYMDTHEIPVAEAALTPDEYGFARHIIADGITKKGLPEKLIETAKGILAPGAKLILASDGLTKNLKMGLDENGKVADISGCPDLAALINGEKESEGIGRKILTRVNLLMALAVAKKGDEHIVQIYPDRTALLPQDDDFSMVVVNYKS